MSYTLVYGVPRRSPIRYVGEVHNAHRGAMAIWDAIARAHCGMEHFPFSNKFASQKVWDRWMDRSIPVEHRAVLASTLDLVIVRRDHIPELIRCMDSFDRDFPGETNLQGQIEVIGPIVRSKLAGVAWNQTSVNSGVWEFPGSRGRDHRFSLARDCGAKAFGSNDVAIWLVIHGGNVGFSDLSLMLTGYADIPPLKG